MKRIEKEIAVVLIAAMFVLSAVGCTTDKNLKNHVDKNVDTEHTDRLTIVTTLFPYYDFARAIIGDVEGVSLSMIVSAGQDSHSFEPTPKDVIAIESADLFIYNGGSIENWVDTVLKSKDEEEQVRLRMMDYVDVLEEQTVEGMDLRFEEEHHHAQEEMDDEKNHGKEAHHEEEVEYDEHIWTSPINAIQLISYIRDEMCQLDPKNATTYQKNAQEYIDQIDQVDTQIRKTVDAMEQKEVIFADKFPLLYFAKEYGLNYYAAFPGCANDSEPSVKTIAFLIDKIREDGINKVYYLELSSQAVANTICQDTDAKAYEFHTCHNLTKKQFDEGVTYVDLMRKNLECLRE